MHARPLLTAALASVPYAIWVYILVRVRVRGACLSRRHGLETAQGCVSGGRRVALLLLVVEYATCAGEFEAQNGMAPRRVMVMGHGAVQETRRHQRVHVRCAEHYGRPRRYHMFRPAARPKTKAFFWRSTKQKQMRNGKPHKAQVASGNSTTPAPLC